MIDNDLAARAQAVAGYSFSDVHLLINALRHSSGTDTRLESNERLEFLGDAVLGIVICDELFRQRTDWLEGDLTKVKSMVVSRRVCAEIADEVGLTSLLILGNGINGEADLPQSLKAAVFESIIGAIYIDGGLDAARAFILRHTAQHIERWSAGENRENHKSALQQYAQRWMSTTPRYEGLDEKGPDHSKCFEVCVVVGNQRFPSAWGPNKKDAEQEAARRALEMLRDNGHVESDTEEK